MTTIVSITALPENGPIGFSIKTLPEENEIIIKVSSEKKCCEHFGVTEPAYSYLLEGAIIESVEHRYCGKSAEDENALEADNLERIPFNNENGNAYVTLHTNRGDFVYHLWNQHNGYYPHAYSVKSNGNWISGYL